MKTTIELPDDLFRKAKATAALRGTALKEFVREAIEEKLHKNAAVGSKKRGWPVPPPNITRAEAELIDKHLETFEQVDPEDWD